MSYVNKEDVIKAINSQIFMKPATKERLRQTVNAVPAADVVCEIFADIEKWLVLYGGLRIITADKLEDIKRKYI